MDQFSDEAIKNITGFLCNLMKVKVRIENEETEIK